MAGYSRAVKVGDRVFVSGTTASDAAGVVQHPGDAAQQTHYVIEKIATALEQAGSRLQDVVRTRIFVRNIDDWPAVARAHGEKFATICPACTLVRAELIEPAMLVEIEAEAIISTQP
ncbi:MAG: RidA family protein [Oscillochloris sp.]|nr:RidA family protein [Oscillochloris sp.]